MKILITGGAGFIGSWLVESLLGGKDEVVVLDNLSPQIHGDHPRLDVPWLHGHPRLRFERGDVRDRVTVDRLLSETEVVVHLAAETGTGQSMYQIDHYYDVNVQATAGLFQSIATRHRHIRKVLLASSRAVYGEGAYRLGNHLVVPQPRDTRQLAAGRWELRGPNDEALTLIATPEDAPPRPASVYAATKLANEQLGKVFADAYGISVVALRLQNVYGERQSLRNPYTGILSIFSNRMRQGLPINIFEDGLESRDFVHVGDVVRAMQLALTSDLPGYTVANVGSGVATSVLEVARTLARVLGSTSPLHVSGEYRVGDIRHCYADLGRARELLGFDDPLPLEQGLQRFCDWVLTQDVVEDGSRNAQDELTRRGLGKVAST